MKYLTHTDLSRLVLYSKLKAAGIKQALPTMDTEQGRTLLQAVIEGQPPKGSEADYNRIQRLASTK